MHALLIVKHWKPSFTFFLLIVVGVLEISQATSTFFHDKNELLLTHSVVLQRVM